MLCAKHIHSYIQFFQICSCHRFYIIKIHIISPLSYAHFFQLHGLIDLFWYDGGMKPPTPDEIRQEDRELFAEGMMLVGDKGKILCGFRGENPQVFSGPGARELGNAEREPMDQKSDNELVNTFKGVKSTYADFTLGEPISDAFNLAAISLRMGGQKLVWDTASGRITNMESANKYRTREYRQGWELTA